MNIKLPQFIQNHRFTTGLMIADLILFILLFPTQGLQFIILSFLFGIFFFVTIGLLLKIKTSLMIDKKLEGGLITLDVSVKNKRIVSVCIIFMLVMVGILCFLSYSIIVPNIKAVFNDGYLNDTVNEIIEGKNTDYEKISAILRWFDPEKENLYNSWFLTHSENPYLSLSGTYMIFVLETPYICVRCFEDIDPRWLLTSRCGACGEFSRLFMIMVDTFGIDVKRIHAPGEDHVWNEVKIDGDWIPVDPTNVSFPDGGDGWEHYGFFEWKEGNASYVWADFLNNDTILDCTHFYTKLTNVTISCVDESNNSISNVTITVMSNNLHDEDRIRETSVKGRQKPKTNSSGSVTFQIGGGTYKFKGNTEKYSGETEWVRFSDNVSEHYFIIEMNL